MSVSVFPVHVSMFVHYILRTMWHIEARIRSLSVYEDRSGVVPRCALLLPVRETCCEPKRQILVRLHAGCISFLADFTSYISASSPLSTSGSSYVLTRFSLPFHVRVVAKFDNNPYRWSDISLAAIRLHRTKQTISFF